MIIPSPFRYWGSVPHCGENETIDCYGLAVIVVCAFSDIISFIRNIIPNRIRIIVQLTVVAAMVILVDQF
jgi:Na+-transporting NADH:ubiquinone oxidoreductase subunit NqrD